VVCSEIGLRMFVPTLLTSPSRELPKVVCMAVVRVFRPSVVDMSQGIATIVRRLVVVVVVVVVAVDDDDDDDDAVGSSVVDNGNSSVSDATAAVQSSCPLAQSNTPAAPCANNDRAVA